MSDFSANAILTKSLAKYGKRLTANDYQNLLSCMSVREIALYLKGSTRYKAILDGINENDIHRGYLELLLKKSLIKDVENIFAYSTSGAAFFSNYVIADVSIKLLMRALDALYSEEDTDIEVLVPNFIKKRSQVDFLKLLKAKSFGEILTAVKKSEYYKVLKEFTNDGENTSLPMIENALYKHMYITLINEAQERLSGEKKKRDSCYVYKFSQCTKLHKHSETKEVLSCTRKGNRKVCYTYRLLCKQKRKGFD